jgi:hypothetical protein
MEHLQPAMKRSTSCYESLIYNARDYMHAVAVVHPVVYLRSAEALNQPRKHIPV